MAATMNQVQTFKGGDSMFTKDQVRQLVFDMAQVHAENAEREKAWVVNLLREQIEVAEGVLKAVEQELADETDINMQKVLHEQRGRAVGEIETLRAVIDLLEGNLVAEEDV